MSKLAEHELELRDCWEGRSVWRTWKGDMWGRRRDDWVMWAKQAKDPHDGYAQLPSAHGEKRRKYRPISTESTRDK